MARKNGKARRIVKRRFKADIERAKRQHRLADKIIAAVEEECDRAGTKFVGGDERLGSMASQMSVELSALIDSKSK